MLAPGHWDLNLTIARCIWAEYEINSVTNEAVLGVGEVCEYETAQRSWLRTIWRYF